MADTNSRAFYRISTATGAVDPIDLGAVTDIGADGLLLRDGESFSVTSVLHPEGEISVLRLSEDYTRARVQRRINGRGMDYPSTAATSWWSTSSTRAPRRICRSPSYE